ncbi:MAG: metallophosphoesterase [Desulfobacterales bacterium]|nr:metallophosphoesterase [Desulfobacterales bacterium]
MKFIHLSDLHIGRSDNTDSTLRIIDGIFKKQDSLNCKCIVITGDIVDDGEIWQFREAKK